MVAEGGVQVQPFRLHWWVEMVAWWRMATMYRFLLYIYYAVQKFGLGQVYAPVSIWKSCRHWLPVALRANFSCIQLTYSCEWIKFLFVFMCLSLCLDCFFVLIIGAVQSSVKMTQTKCPLLHLFFCCVSISCLVSFILVSNVSWHYSSMQTLCSFQTNIVS